MRLARSRVSPSAGVRSLVGFSRSCHAKLTDRIQSWVLATVLDALIGLGIVSLVCGLAGVGDALDEASAFMAVGVSTSAVAAVVRCRVVRPARPLTRHVIAGVGIVWVVFVLFGAIVYLATGSLVRIDDAVVEATAGFTTTALTGLDLDSASRSVLLWRAATSWVGGLVSLIASVVVMPNALRDTHLLSYTSRRHGRDLVPKPGIGLRRVCAIYTGLTSLLVIGYLIAGLPVVESVIVGLGTISTGGFSPHPDSMSGYGGMAQAVATAGMLTAGSSIFVAWWILRGRVKSLARSNELRTYAFLVISASVVVMAVSPVGIGEALFTVASLSSTTGYAIVDWTDWPATAVTALMIAAGVGAMMGSAGGGMQVRRIRLLFGYIRRDLRRQLNPRAVLPVHCDGRVVRDQALLGVGSYQITQATLISLGAVALGCTGLTVTGSVWSSLSSVCTLGPAVGEIGAYGDLNGLSRPSRGMLVPLMLAGRVAILPLLAVLSVVAQWPRYALRRARWLAWWQLRRFEPLYRRESARIGLRSSGHARSEDRVDLPDVSAGPGSSASGRVNGSDG